MILRPDESCAPRQGRLAAAEHARRAIACAAADVRLDGVPVDAKAQALLMQRQVIPAADSELDPDAFDEASGHVL